MGTKKMQQVLAEPKILERYMNENESEQLRKCFTGLYSLEEKNEKIIQEAIKNYKDYVLKPQREGGGNLIYGEKMKKMLENLTETDRKSYILMKRIKPIPISSHIVKEGKLIAAKIISELGIYGVYLGYFFF